MKRLLCLMLACLLCGSIVLTACSNENTEKPDEAAQDEVSQADIEEMMTGKWVIAERSGQPALTNEKLVFTFASPTKAYMSASFNARPELGTQWMDLLEADVAISGNTVTITRNIGKDAATVNELTVSDITDTEIKGSLNAKLIEDGEETLITEETISIIRISDDFSEDILGTWEGRCTSEGSVFDDGQEHRWEFRDDGTYVYYVQDGDNWVPSENTLNEYFVDGNLLCSRWIDKEQEHREWWEISIDGEKMNWTALREGDDGKTFTSAFEMNQVESTDAAVSMEVTDFEDGDVQDRMLSDWDGRWQSAYPYALDGSLDKAFELMAKSEKMTAEEYKEYYKAALETDIAFIRIDGESNRIEYEYTDGHTCKSEYQYVGYYIQV